ncbi:MAG: hypothetical protein C6W55_01290 [Thermobacillus sp.]|nr:MAG: hypothetical protein C6W55_01290 [Thermobacillus sp.]
MRPKGGAEMAEWSAAAAAASFVVLTIALLAALRGLMKRLNRFEQTIRSIEAESVPLLREIRGLAAEAGQVMRRTGRQVERLDRLLDAAQQWEGAVRRSASTVSRITEAVDRAASAHVEQAIVSGRARIGETLDWAELGWSVWKWWQTKRAAAANPDRMADDMRDPE